MHEGIMRLLKICMLLLLLCGFATATSSDAAFERFKGFEGRWAIQANGKTLPIEMTYEIGSKGSIVIERFGKELSVFYRDGGDLLVTHFCNGGNQPRLRLKEDVVRGTLEFDMFDITNLASPQAAHVQRIIYRLTTDTAMNLEIVWKEGGAETSEKYVLTKL
jgi:hypothetical protein